MPLLYIWLLNIQEESHLQKLLGTGELFIVSMVLISATLGEIYRERKSELRRPKSSKIRPGSDGNRSPSPSQGYTFACIVIGFSAVAGYGGIANNGSIDSAYLSIGVFLAALVVGALIMNLLEKDE